jgi:carboxyl-terminal processing protease
VDCAFRTPGGERVEIKLTRRRRTDPDPWLRPFAVLNRNEFLTYFDENMFNEALLSTAIYEFKMLEGNLAYMALNVFMGPVADVFEEKLPILRSCAGIIIDLRKNHGGNDENAYLIASYFLRQPGERLPVYSRKIIANYRAYGALMKDTPPEQMAELEEWQRESLLCYREQWFEAQDGEQVLPASAPLDCPAVILTSSETGSAAEDFLMALETGHSPVIRIGQATAGSSGQPLRRELPGGGIMGICTLRMPWPEKVAEKGIEPHIRVEPTVEDIFRDEDRVLSHVLPLWLATEDSKLS